MCTAVTHVATRNTSRRCAGAVAVNVAHVHVHTAGKATPTLRRHACSSRKTSSPACFLLQAGRAGTHRSHPFELSFSATSPYCYRLERCTPGRMGISVYVWPTEGCNGSAARAGRIVGRLAVDAGAAAETRKAELQRPQLGRLVGWCLVVDAAVTA